MKWEREILLNEKAIATEVIWLRQRFVACAQADESRAWRDLALEIFRFQAQVNPVYRRYVELMEVDAMQVRRIEDIPFLPVELFQTQRVSVFPSPNSDVHCFESSGTTGSLVSKHSIDDLEWYDRSSRRSVSWARFALHGCRICPHEQHNQAHHLCPSIHHQNDAACGRSPPRHSYAIYPAGRFLRSNLRWNSIHSRQWHPLSDYVSKRFIARASQHALLGGFVCSAHVHWWRFWWAFHSHCCESLSTKPIGSLALNLYHMKDSKQSQPQFAFQKSNYQWLIGGIGLLIIGYILMSGGASEDPTAFSYEIFSFRRITLAPIVVLTGYGTIFYAILKR